MSKEIFHNRKLVIATMHQKEQVIAPLLSSRLRVKTVVPAHFNTDKFGTFSGEVERMLDPLSTAREKCHLAMEVSGCDLAVASEGSFGMHPSVFFVPCDEEFVLLVDKLHQLEIAAIVLSTDTNFSGDFVTQFDELERFAQKAGFPEHALILRDSKDSNAFIKKGIRTWQTLEEHFRGAMKLYGQAYVETDMRALYNPKRMAVIRQATKELAERASTECPVCNTPGFGITGVKTGLPCASCGSPTQSVHFYVHSCTRCGFSKKIKNTAKELEDPMYCDYCNP